MLDGTNIIPIDSVSKNRLTNKGRDIKRLKKTLEIDLELINEI